MRAKKDEEKRLANEIKLQRALQRASAMTTIGPNRVTKPVMTRSHIHLQSVLPADRSKAKALSDA